MTVRAVCQPVVRPVVGSVVDTGFSSGEGGGGSQVVTAILLGQSEMEYLFNTSSFYRQIAHPTPGDGNLIVFTQGAVDAPPVRTVVNATTVANDEVNPAMGALSAFLAYVRPGYTFVLGDAAVAGTSRRELHDEADPDRKWSDLVAVVDDITTEFGSVQHMIECWYNADAAYIENFKTNFWPHYFGMNANGTLFTLGDSVLTVPVEHCFWDGNAATDELGRGIFTRDGTKWHIVTPMPFWNMPEDPDPEAEYFSEGDPRLTEPCRASMHALVGDTFADSVDLIVGPSAHICRFGNGSTTIHPDVDTPDGQIELMYACAGIPLLRASGLTITEPEIVDISGPENGSYVDIEVSLPNGGTLTTKRILREEAAPSPEPPHWQEVVGFEVTRSATRHPVYKESETTYNANFRGTVEIQDTGSGSPRRGKVRITPENAFAYGNTISYLRGQATGGLLEPRDLDAQLYLDHLIEHIPGYYDDSATYPFEGIAVKPYQADLTVPISSPPFAPRSAVFNNASGYAATAGVSVAATSNGLFSMWVKSTAASWNAESDVFFRLRVGSTITFGLQTASSGRITFRVNNDTATDTLSFYSSQPGNVQFAINTWYHVLVAWNATGAVVYVNDVQVGTMTYASVDMNGNNITQLGVGCESSGANFVQGEIGHLWASVSQTLDITVQANREKFALAGDPVDLGGDGSLPTGTAPEWYYDGDAGSGDWNNKGTAGNVTLTGSLSAGTTPGY